jgi:hypothetical protein
MKGRSQKKAIKKPKAPQPSKAQKSAINTQLKSTSNNVDANWSR